jgi:hypothetical protein
MVAAAAPALNVATARLSSRVAKMVFFMVFLIMDHP